MEWRVCENYGTNYGPTNGYVQFISKPYRKHCRASDQGYQSAVYAAQDEERRMQTLGFVRMDPDQIKEARLISIVALSKEAGLMNSTL